MKTSRVLCCESKRKERFKKERINNSVEHCWVMSGTNEMIPRVIGFSALSKSSLSGLVKGESGWSELWGG